MEYTVVPGYSYAVTASEDCTLTAANGWKLELKAGIQQHFTAQFDTFTASAPITLNVNFNSAPAGSAASGGVSEEDLVEKGVLEVPEIEELTTVQTSIKQTGTVSAGGYNFIFVNLSAVFNAIRIYGSTTAGDELVAEIKVSSTVVRSVRFVRGDGACTFYFEHEYDRKNLKQISVFTTSGALVKFSFCAGGAKPAALASGSWSGASSSLYPCFELLLSEVKTLPSCAVAPDAVPTEGSTRPVSSGGVFAALAAVGGEDAHSVYALHIVGDLYVGDAYWSNINHGGEVVIPLGGTIRMVKLTGDNGGESPVRALLILSEPKTAQQLSSYLQELTHAAAEQFYLVPATVNG